MTEHTIFLPEEDDSETGETAIDGQELSRLIGTIAAGDTSELVRFASIVRKSRHPVLRAEQEVELAQTMEIGAFAARILQLRKEAPDEAAAYDYLANPDAPDEFTTELTLLAQEGEEARRLFTESNTRLVMFQLRRSLSYRKGPAEESALADVISQGNMGLLRAVDKFDYTKGYKFSTYALTWINKFVNEELDRQGPLELTPYVMRKMKQYRAMVTKLTEEQGCPPTTAEAADLLGEANSYIVWLDRMCASSVSYDENPGPDTQANTISIAPQESFKNPGEDLREVVQDDLITLLHEILDNDTHDEGLNDLRVQSVLLFFGITSPDRTPMVFRDIAKHLGLTHAQVRHFLTVARAKLREATTHHQELKVLLQP